MTAAMTRGGRPWSLQLSWDAYANSLSEIRCEHEAEAVPEPLPFAPPGPARGSLPLRRVRPSSNGHASAQLAG